MLEPVLLMDPWRHAVRGVSGSLAAVTLLANAMGNRRALLSLSLRPLRFAAPTRNALAVAVFVGVFRFVERFERRRARVQDAASVRKASLAASALAILCVHPSSRTPFVALLSTNAVSLWFREFMAAHPELSALQLLDLLVFMASGGWIVYSALFQPESYEPLHMKLIMKYSLTSQEAATYLQTRYRAGLNPHTCEARHPGLACTDFLLRKFVWQVVGVALRIYVPVHLTTWLLALRHRAVRHKPLRTLLRRFVVKLARSMLYFIGYIVFGWTIPCYTRPLGAISPAWRKLQFFIAGSLPALSILFESPARRRPIAVVLSSYAFVSMGTVLSRQRLFTWLQQGSGPVRSVIDVVTVAAAVAYTMETMLQGNGVFKRLLFGQAPRHRKTSDAHMPKDVTHATKPTSPHTTTA